MPNNSDLDMGYLLRLEPKMAVDYLKSKGYKITWNWQEQLDAAHAKAFTVAKVTKLDVLETLRQATEDAVQSGMSERDFIKQLEPKLRALGWWGKQEMTDDLGRKTVVQLGSPRRLRTILRTNKITAYHAGRYAEQIANSDEQPYWQYVAVQDSRTRPSHMALHGKVYRFDDPIWDTLYPPNGWGCRCRVRALSDFQLNNLGLSVDESGGRLQEEWALAGSDPLSGEETHSKITVFKTNQGTIKTEPGWNYNVGQAALGTDRAVIRKLLQVQNRELRQQTIQAINNSEARHKAFADWVKAMLSKDKHDNKYMTVGIIGSDIAEKVTEISNGNKTTEQLLVMTERNFTHANSPKHREKGVALSKEDFASLPQIIAQPLVIVWDKKHNNLIYVNQAKTIKVVAELSPRDKKVRFEPKEKLDAVINTYKLDYGDFVGKVKKGDYVIIKGSL
ncbi:phage head morphogenesis protein [Haemophilus quentini]|uniref:phage head morphogenesis protein n=1 Tax=Haemophilus quentini TaxID=123834 RepID=UPI00021B3599|nr:phage head morphogenesis protein [Haemophilus quentini]EGT81806.1 F protein [Haemophilus haemolyticus M21639]ORC32919.1 phage head morphogenesis protein [Haemophilus quentini]